MHVFDPPDVITLVRGKHVVHFGGEFLINRANSTSWGNINAASINAEVDELLRGWQVSSTFVVQGGNPTGITTGGNKSSNNQSGSYTQCANLVADVTAVPNGRQNCLYEWYNLDALAVPAPYTYGDFRRNTVYGPGLSEVNASLGKSFNLWPERNVRMQSARMRTISSTMRALLNLRTADVGHCK